MDNSVRSFVAHYVPHLHVVEKKKIILLACIIAIIPMCNFLYEKNQSVIESPEYLGTVSQGDVFEIIEDVRKVKSDADGVDYILNP